MAVNEKKKYEKPRVIGVELIPEEAVLANCKTKQASGYADSGCYYTSGMNVCWAASSIGS
jgi:hypothetical protein